MKIAEVRIPDTPDSIFYICPNDMTAWRAQTLFTKEPITIEWLNALTADDVFWDVGANVGMYTLYAAVRAKCRTYAFEPESQNYAVLTANIRHNHVDDHCWAYCVALGDRFQVDVLNLSQFKVGGSCHTFGEEVSWSGKKMNPDFKQGCIQLRAFSFCDGGFPEPTHVKIDVDGREPQVVGSILSSRFDPLPKSLIIETNWNLESHRGMVARLERAGYQWSQEQADAAKRKDGAFVGVGETVFTRA